MEQRPETIRRSRRHGMARLRTYAVKRIHSPTRAWLYWAGLLMVKNVEVMANSAPFWSTTLAVMVAPSQAGARNETAAWRVSPLRSLLSVVMFINDGSPQEVA